MSHHDSIKIPPTRQFALSGVLFQYNIIRDELMDGEADP